MMPCSLATAQWLLTDLVLVTGYRVANTASIRSAWATRCGGWCMRRAMCGNAAIKARHASYAYGFAVRPKVFSSEMRSSPPRVALAARWGWRWGHRFGALL